jgi:hypothetical protein
MWHAKGRFVSDTTESLGGMVAIRNERGVVIGAMDTMEDAKLAASAPALIKAASALLSAFGGDVPDWLKDEWQALAKACADAEGFPKE